MSIKDSPSPSFYCCKKRLTHFFHEEPYNGLAHAHRYLYSNYSLNEKDHVQAPTHILVIPRSHIAGLSDFTDADQKLAGELMTIAVKIAAKEGLVPTGYRFVINNGVDGGQTVSHLHLHILGGRALAWPPG